MPFASIQMQLDYYHKSEKERQITYDITMMGSIKDRNGRDLTEAEDIKKR